MLTLGSLFDGIGVFPLAATMNGITPVWASEIEKAPISITTRHFPDMLHLGDIQKLNGGDIPAVDVLTFGSPCQNLSLMGDRTGIGGVKSSLFFQAIRILQEMRDATHGRFPSIAVWENVMGSLSSGHRLDYYTVLRSFTGAQISMPLSGAWANAGVVRGGCPDLAWRLMDAQYWARPPLARRQRIFIVADFTGQRASEILFKPRPMLPDLAFGTAGGLSASGSHRGSFIQAGGRIPIVYPFQALRMRGAATRKKPKQFVGSFGKPGDPFPTILAGDLNAFAFWYEDDPLGGYLRFLTETECERLMGLPDGWTRYGADSREISATNRYKALGNSIAVPCASYIMAGIAEVLNG